MCWMIPSGYTMGTDGVMRYVGPRFDTSPSSRSISRWARAALGRVGAGKKTR
jgi:hypothetical protein